MPYIIIAAFVLIVGLGSHINDKQIQSKGGKTEYITKFLHK